MVNDQTEIREFLDNFYLFKTLSPAVVDKITAKAHLVKVQPQRIIYRAGSENKYFYIVISGSLLEQRVGKEDFSLALSETECFGYEALSAERYPYRSSVTAKTSSILLSIENQDILDLSKQIPELKQIFSLLLRNYHLQQRKHLSWRNSGERVLYMSRRHISDLYTGLIAPLGVAVLGYLVVLVLFNLLPQPVSPSIFQWSGFVAILCVLWAMYNIVDWTNDYYIFTNQRVVLLEKVILFYDSRQESPLEAVQSITTSTELFGRMMTFGNVSIRTYTGLVNFPHIEAPQMIINLVENSVRMIRDQHLADQSKQIEQSIRDRIQGSQFNQKGDSPVPVKSEGFNPSVIKKEGFLIKLLKLKEVAADTITYRTHWFILIAKTIAPFLLFVATLTALIFRLNGYLPKIPIQIAGISAAILCLSAWLWWIYQFIDWRNDVYIITPDQVVDINRKPLGHEERRAAPIKNIQTIEFKRVGIFGLLFNFGTVFIRIGDSELTFDYVSDPSSVQRDLFERFMQLAEQEKQTRLEQENQRMGAWIETYHRLVANKDDQNESPDSDQFSE